MGSQKKNFFEVNTFEAVSANPQLILIEGKNDAVICLLQLAKIDLYFVLNQSIYSKLKEFHAVIVLSNI